MILACLCAAGSVNAKQVMGLSLGEATFEQVRIQLKNASASFEDDFSYKNSGDTLRMMKVHDFTKFAKYGDVKEAWLYFTPDKTLYKISVTWDDTENGVSQRLQSVLDAKYGLTKKYGMDYGIHYQDSDSDTTIKLWLNKPCGREPATTLMYIYNPLTATVNQAKREIDEAVRRKKANSLDLPDDL